MSRFVFQENEAVPTASEHHIKAELSLGTCENLDISFVFLRKLSHSLVLTQGDGN